MTHKSVVVVVSSVWVLSAFIALLGLKWIQILGFISIHLPSEEEEWNIENFLGLCNYSRNESFSVSVSLERENSCRAIEAIQKPVPYKDRNLMTEAEGFREAVAEHESN